ncbi:MAG TPA: ATP-binding protein [Clostridia bacterium]|jgi:serine/threonine-protein kinase RsbW|nr:ATP-binding protein [Clostridia bacterium]
MKFWQIENLCLESALEQIELASSTLLSLLEKNGITDSDLVFTLRLVLHEALSNAIIHGNQEDKNKKVFLRLMLNEDRIVLEVEDEGNGFNYEERQRDEEVDLLHDGGRGLIILESLLDELVFKDNGKRVIMTKYLNRGK